jgi:NMD protein affecting ribosome stability and mRNA decay
MVESHKDMYYNPNLNVKEWWKRIPDSSDYGTTSYKTIYSYEICPTCESDLVDGKCVICNGDDD